MPHGERFYDIKLTIIRSITLIKCYLGCALHLHCAKWLTFLELSLVLIFLNLSKLHQGYYQHLSQHTRQSTGSHQNRERVANVAMTAKQQALLFSITGVGKGGTATQTPRIWHMVA
jgi:hypothetical protein